ncbi:MAG: alpha/beta hydrolase [Pseudomonadota bacterium]
MRLILWLAGLLGLGLVVLAGLSAWLSRDTEARFPPLGPRVEAGKARLHYAVDGTGPALVLLHGAGANLRDFGPSLVPRLANDFKVIRIDRPGSGYSETLGDGWLNPSEQAGAVRALLRELGVEEAVWVGHSWGGSLVMSGLLDDPRAVRGGVLLAGAAYPWTGGVDLSDELPAWPVVGPVLTHTLIPVLGRMLLAGGTRAVFAPNPPTAGYREQTGIALYLRPGQFAATARDIRHLSPFLEEQAPRYTEISNPLLVIHGTEDTIVPAWNHTDRLERLLPQVEVVRLAETGHAPHHSHADAVAERIRIFARATLGGAP